MEEETPLTLSFDTQPAPSFSPPTSSIAGIIRKAIWFLIRSKKLMLQLFIITVVPLLILVVLHTVIALPLIGKVAEGLEEDSLDLQDLTSLVIAETPFASAFCLVLLFASAFTISAASSHGGASLDLKEALLSIKSIWKRVLVSGLCTSFLKIAFVVAAMATTQLTALVAVLAALTYPYLASICALVLVISTLDDEHQGIMAFRHTMEVAGKDRSQGYLLMLVLALLSFPVYVLFYVTTTDDDDANGMIAQLGFVSMAAALLCLLNIFNDVVCTLFYLEYKQRNGNKIEESESFSDNSFSSFPCVG